LGAEFVGLCFLIVRLGEKVVVSSSACLKDCAASKLFFVVVL